MKKPTWHKVFKVVGDLICKIYGHRWVTIDLDDPAGGEITVCGTCYIEKS